MKSRINKIKEDNFKKGLKIVIMIGLILFCSFVIYDYINKETNIKKYYCPMLGKGKYEVYPCYEVFDCDWTTFNASIEINCK